MTQLDMFDQPSPEQSGLGTIEFFYFLAGNLYPKKEKFLRHAPYTVPVRVKKKRTCASLPAELAKIGISATDGIVLVSYNGQEPLVLHLIMQANCYRNWEKTGIPWSHVLNTLASWKDAREKLIEDFRDIRTSGILDIFACVREGNFERLAMETT